MGTNPFMSNQGFATSQTNPGLGNQGYTQSNWLGYQRGVGCVGGGCSSVASHDTGVGCVGGGCSSVASHVIGVTRETLHPVTPAPITFQEEEEEGSSPLV